MLSLPRSRWLVLGGIALALLVVLAASVAVQREEGYFSPVISPDGNHVYFVKRSTTGLVWGLGVEFFTPPAKARAWRDRFELCRVRIDGSGFETVYRWAGSPLEGKTIEEYRGRVFGYPQVVLRFEQQRLQYQIALSIPKQPQSDQFALTGLWEPQAGVAADAGAWQTRFAPLGSGEDMLREPWEVLAVRGPESFPCAVVAYNDQAAQLRVLHKTGACDKLYPNGIRWEDVAERSRAKEIRRLRSMRELRDRLIGEAITGGASEGVAILGADRRLEDLGYYPKPPQLIARRVAATDQQGGQPLFRISEMEFKVGLFNDIEQAIAAPGREIEKSMGLYIVHRDYTTSQRLNEFLESGGKRFYVERQGELYELTVTERKPASR